MKFGEYASQWLELKKLTITPTSYQRYRVEISRLNGTFGQTELNDIDSAAIQKFINSLSAVKAPKTVKSCITQFKSMLRDAEADELRQPKILRLKLPREKKKEYKVLSEDDFKKLYDYCVKDKSWAATAILITMQTGLRIGEMCGLQWRDIDFENRIIRITKAVKTYSDENHKYHCEIGCTKTFSSQRDIFLSVSFAQTLKRRYSNQPPTDYVICGELPRQPRTLQEHYRKYLSAHGIPYIPFHALRHGFATRAIEKGVDPRTVAEFLGHSDCSMTLNIYTSCTAKMKRAASEVIM